MIKYTDEMKKIDEELRHFHYMENGRFNGRFKMVDVLSRIWFEARLDGLIPNHLSVRIDTDKMDWRPWFVVVDRDENAIGSYCYAKDLIKFIEENYYVKLK